MSVEARVLDVLEATFAGTVDAADSGVRQWLDRRLLKIASASAAGAPLEQLAEQLADAALVIDRAGQVVADHRATVAATLAPATVAEAA